MMRQLFLPQLTANSTISISNTAVINGRPFNGTGVGYNSSLTHGGKTDAFQTEDNTSNPGEEIFKYALLPNAVHFDENLGQLMVGTAMGNKNVPPYNVFPGVGGSDESYDAVDFQNIFLGMMPLNPAESAPYKSGRLTNWGLDNVFGNEDDQQVVIPSFHRPALINYWNSQLPDFENEPTVLRKVLLRPNWMDHPEFTGSNPEFSHFVGRYRDALAGNNTTKMSQFSDELIDRSIYGPWDVDNDNDGIRDSVWVDFGAPVMEGPDGKLVKPLAAVLVLDMDGRLNVNAHSTVEMAKDPVDRPLSITLAGTTSDTLPRGEGYGPADIYLGAVLEDLDDTTTNLQDTPIKRLFGIASSSLQENLGRHGSNLKPGSGNTIRSDTLSVIKTQGLPTNARGYVDETNMQLGEYATPPNYSSRYTVGLNDLGQPTYDSYAYRYQTETVDPVQFDVSSPYQANLSLNASRAGGINASDGMYSVAEFERFLRAFDSDASMLPSRLWRVADDFSTSNATDNGLPVDTDELGQWRTLLTTDSFDMPTPSVTTPAWILNGPDGIPNNSDDITFQTLMNKLPVNLTFSEILEYRLHLAAYSGNGPYIPLPPQQIKALLYGGEFPIGSGTFYPGMMPMELADGLRLDINRPFGNGRDDNYNGVVDEPGEYGDADFGEFDRGYNPTYWRSDPSNPIPGSFLNLTKSIYRDVIDQNGDGIINADDIAQIDLNNTGTIDSFEELVLVHNNRRQQMARDLYILAMTIVDPFDTTTDEGKAKVRRLAQWAINVVDYRDPDNCMTPFEYDSNPFNGWDVDIDGIPNAIAYYKADPEKELVWGSERPELLITETLAWHDLMVEDLPSESQNQGQSQGTTTESLSSSSGKIPDIDLDQQVKPRGGFFVELYNPWPTNPATNADTHVKDPATGEDRGVNIAAVAEPLPEQNVQSTPRSPVWRLMVYENDGFGLDPDDPDDLYHPRDPDRSVYFAGFEPNYNDDGVAYYNDPNKVTITNNSVRPGRYMIVGSGYESALDPNTYEVPFIDPRQSQSGTQISSRRFEMDLNQNATIRVRMADEEDATYRDTVGNFLRQSPREEFTKFPLAFSSDESLSITDVAVINMPRRLTLSEPSEGYPNNYPPGNPKLKWYSPDGPLASDPSTHVMYPYGFYGVSPTTVKAIDTPLDASSTIDPTAPWSRTDGVAFDEPVHMPNFRRVFLQRLSNPLLPWNPAPTHTQHRAGEPVNPYMVVDWTYTNLTVISGRLGMTGSTAVRPNEDVEDDFYSAERGWYSESDAQTENFWSTDKIFDPSQPGTNPRQPFTGIGGRVAPLQQPDNANNNKFTLTKLPECTIGYLNRSFNKNQRTSTVVPDQPFPWLAWNNRPFISSSELLQVPTMRSSQLLRAFSLSKQEEYDGSPKVIDPDVDKPLILDGRYGHLPNFFRDKTDNSNVTIAGLYRVLDFLHVPSRFTGTETWLNPDYFGNQINSVEDPRMNRQPPFNNISNYRDPGRVNLNTMVDAAVWDGGIMHRQPNNIGGLGIPDPPYHPLNNNYQAISGHLGPLFIDFNVGPHGIVESRRGYSHATLIDDKQPLLLNPNIPTFFANPFRSPDAGNLVPINALQRQSVDCSLLRRKAYNPGPDGKWGAPNTDDDGNGIVDDISEFKQGANDDVLDEEPLLTGISTLAHNNTARNSYFRYQPMTRLANLTTNRSNVFAIWITIGFFEVEEFNDDTNNPDQTHLNILLRYDGATTIAEARNNQLFQRVYPDGFMLGQEAGSETGNVHRIREFAIIDRTIPVGFEPGKNHNVERAVRLRRRIE